MSLPAAHPQKTFSAAPRPGDPSLYAEIWANRSILWLLTRRELKARYAGSMLGITWNIIHPIVMIAIYILILGTILSGKLGGGVTRGAYTVHLCAGIIPWLVFQEIVLRCSSTLLENAGFIKKVAFPEIILHLTAFLNAIFVHAISYTAFILILLAIGTPLGLEALACFGILLTVAVFALGIGLVVSVLNIYFRDVGQLVSIGLQFLFWFTPIVYLPSMLHPPDAGPVLRFLAALLQWNPVAHFTGLSQRLFLGGEGTPFPWLSLAVALLAPIAAVWVGIRIFNHFKRDLLDNI